MLKAENLKAEMPKSFYHTPDRSAALQAEALSWIGTPFFDGIGRRARKGTSCDCVSWVAAALQATGGIGAVPWPEHYVSCTGGPAMLDVLLGTLEKTPGLKRLNTLKTCEPAFSGFQHLLQIGDLLVGSTGRSNHHIALFTGDNHIVHCWQGKVIESNVHDTALVRHMHSIWRAYGA